VAVSGDATMTSGGVVDIAADAITAAEIADGAISEEHLDVTAVTGLTAVAPASGDHVIIYDADGTALKKATLGDIVSTLETQRPEAPPTPTSSSDMRFKK
ncbi:uncharacterized protein METZ01_LOCUS271855, partial [marine metagenome]